MFLLSYLLTFILRLSLLMATLIFITHLLLLIFDPIETTNLNFLCPLLTFAAADSVNLQYSDPSVIKFSIFLCYYRYLLLLVSWVSSSFAAAVNLQLPDSSSKEDVLPRCCSSLRQGHAGVFKWIDGTDITTEYWQEDQPDLWVLYGEGESCTHLICLPSQLSNA